MATEMESNKDVPVTAKQEYARCQLSRVLAEIEQSDLDYATRYPLVFEALGWACLSGFDAGVGFDPNEGPQWPVVYIDLPTGQVSWHQPQYRSDWDNHTTEQKYQRIRDWRDSRGEVGRTMIGGLRADTD